MRKQTMRQSRARHESVLKLNQKKDLLAKKTFLMVEWACRSMEKVTDEKRPGTWSFSCC